MESLYKKGPGSIEIRVDCPDMSVRTLKGLVNTVDVQVNAEGQPDFKVRMSLTEERINPNELRPTWNREPVGKPTGKNHRCEDLGAWSTRGVAGIQLIRVDCAGGKRLERGQYHFRSQHYFSRAFGMYDFHPDDAPNVRVSMMYSEGDSGPVVVDEYHKAVRLRVREQMGLHGFRCRSFRPPERIIKTPPFRMLWDKIVSPDEMRAMLDHPNCRCEEPVKVEVPMVSTYMGERVSDEVYRHLSIFHERGGPELYKPLRPFLKPALEASYEQFRTQVHHAIAREMGIPGELLVSSKQAEDQNLMRIFRPLKTMVMRPPLHLVKAKGLAEMSMKCTVAIVGAQYHPGAGEALRRLQVHYDRKGPWKYPNENQAKLDLVREPGNAHDPNAVAVHFLGKMLGYVPRQDAKVVAKVMDAGVQVRAKYNGQNTMTLFWPASTKEGVDAAYRIAMAEGEGL